MFMNPLGNTGLNISCIGLGSWAIGGGQWQWGWGAQDDNDSIKTIHKALDNGINWIDTAPAYGLGHAEEVIAKALQQTDQQPFVFTKCGIVWDDEGNNWPDINAGLVKRDAEESLQRLNVEALDLLQVHWPLPSEHLAETWEAMAELKKAGKVKHIGISNADLSQLHMLSKIAPIDVIQPNYSMLVRHIEEDILPYAMKNNIAVINYSPMACGLLSGRMTPERIANLAEDDWRHRHDEFNAPRLEHNMALVELLKQIGTEMNCNAGSVAVAWTLANPAISGAIVGMRKPTQVDEMIKAGSAMLSSGQLDKIENFLANMPD